jgi:LysM repeat protein
MLFVLRVLIVVISLGLAAGCGGGTSASAATKLTIDAQTGTTSVLRPSRATLTCDGGAVATGYLRNTAVAACASVRHGDVQRVVANQRSGRVCSQVYGGPQNAHIAGTIDGRRIDVTVTRSDGCGTTDWEALKALLGDPQREGGPTDTVAPSTAPTTAPPVTYQVKRGDTLTAIAKKFGVPIAAILTLNQLPDADHLVEGQQLRIPPVSPVQIEVTPVEAQAGTGFTFKLTGAKPSETVTFEITSPTGTTTGPPHIAPADGVITASYQTRVGDGSGTWTVAAKGNQGTAAQTSFRVDPAGTGGKPTSTT